jgi:hypothetical protein
MTNTEVEIMINALEDIIENIETYRNDYVHVTRSNVFRHKNQSDNQQIMKEWFTM